MAAWSVAVVLPAEAGKPVPVGVVPSDAPELARPVPRSDSLDAEQILEMARRAVDLVGGMAAFVPDTARTVLLKPNIVKADPPGSGVTTDPRLVRAVALLVHEVAPRARILIAEGSGGWVSPALRDCTQVEVFPERLVDGFEVGGYRQVARELQGQGLDIDCYDLNFGPIRTLQVPGGGLARDEYDLPAPVLDADAWINLPVAKTHGSKITCCMKNHFGLLPGTRYGWNKSEGTPGRPGGAAGLALPEGRGRLRGPRRVGRPRQLRDGRPALDPARPTSRGPRLHRGRAFGP